MTKKIATLAAFAAVLDILVPALANAVTISGRVTAYSPTSITVLDHEAVTVGLNNDTVFTKLIVQKPWQEDIATPGDDLRVGGYVVVHVPDDSGFIAKWVQVSMTGVPYRLTPATVSNAVYTEKALKSLAQAADRRTHPTASESKRPGSVDTAAHCERMAASGRTAMITPLVRSAAPVNEDAAAHRAEAARLRANLSASESKRPGSVDTAAYHERLANEAEHGK